MFFESPQSYFQDLTKKKFQIIIELSDEILKI